MRTRAAAVVVSVLLLAACYAAVLAAGWVSIGREPGSGPPGEGVAVVAALAAMLVGMVLLALFPTRLSLLVPSAAVLVTWVHLYGFDPYYAPSLRRYSDGGIVSVWWVALLAVAAVACTFRRSLAPVGVAVLVLAAGTLLAEGAGH